MEIEFVSGLLFRWMHILAAITAVGGTIFMRLALMPSVGVLSKDDHQALHEQVRSRWAKLVALAIAFLLISGIYNLFVVLRGYELPKYYHPLFGIKFLLALVIFFLASALSGRSAALEKIRRNARFWVTVNLLLAITVVCLSGVLRIGRDSAPRKAAPAASATSAVELPSSEVRR